LQINLISLLLTLKRLKMSDQSGQATIPSQTPTASPSTPTGVAGAFAETLRRSNSKIREDRALAISEDAQLNYRREIEDMRLEKKRLLRDRENMLDLSPTDANSLKLATDFSSKAFISKDIEIGVKVRQLEIKLEIAEARYAYLFGETLA
jgi:hypothetical protein